MNEVTRPTPLLESSAYPTAAIQLPAFFVLASSFLSSSPTNLSSCLIKPKSSLPLSTISPGTNESYTSIAQFPSKVQLPSKSSSTKTSSFVYSTLHSNISLVSKKLFTTLEESSLPSKLHLSIEQ